MSNYDVSVSVRHSTVAFVVDGHLDVAAGWRLLDLARQTIDILHRSVVIDLSPAQSVTANCRKVLLNHRLGGVEVKLPQPAGEEDRRRDLTSALRSAPSVTGRSPSRRWSA